MPRRISARVIINRKALDATREGFVAGMETLGQAIVADTIPPDDPTTEAVIEGGYGIWSDGRKVAGLAQKPKSAKTKTGITLLVGFGFPARFNELGTIHQPARPFFTPAVLEETPATAKYLSFSVRKRIAGVR